MRHAVVASIVHARPNIPGAGPTPNMRVGGPKNCSTVCAIVDTCYEYLLEHQMIGTKWDLPFHFYRPSLEKYGPYQVCCIIIRAEDAD